MKWESDISGVRQSVASRPGLCTFLRRPVVCLMGLLFLCAGCGREKSNRSGEIAPNKPAESTSITGGATRTVTFYKDVAPILYSNCAACHRAGQAAPFSLLDYADVRKRASDIAKLTRQRLMPPWLPEPGHGAFADERRLAQTQIDVLQQWAADGAPEGNPSDAPPRPRWVEGWQLGAPDLVVRMLQPYELAADGPDVYRNFVVPAALNKRRFVRAVEFRPGNAAIVHHAFIKVDRTGESRRLDEQDPEPGFSFMVTPTGAQIPEGHFLSWTPGRVASTEREDLAWPLDPGTDLVLQLHLRRSGKPETVQSEVGLFFTDRPPTQTPFSLLLTSRAIDLAPGAKDYQITDSLQLPVDVEVLAVLPHAHYLGREMRALAVLPNGATNSLLLIKDWNFNWQTDYRYANPVFLPKGTMISMQFAYDNSADNIHNPNQPPKRVTYGPQATDEMAELWLQILPRRREDFRALVDLFQSRMPAIWRGHHELSLRLNPNDPAAHLGLGAALLGTGELDKAVVHLRRAVELKPDIEEAHFYLGYILRKQKSLSEAALAYQQVLRLNPTNHEAHGNLGLVFLEQGNLGGAEVQFENALRIFPDDAIARRNLEFVRRAKVGNAKP